MQAQNFLNILVMFPCLPQYQCVCQTHITKNKRKRNVTCIFPATIEVARILTPGVKEHTFFHAFWILVDRSTR